eukprot:scaffold67802_cov46-Prasinocladus_malaysianus.AAC.3
MATTEERLAHPLVPEREMAQSCGPSSCSCCGDRGTSVAWITGVAYEFRDCVIQSPASRRRAPGSGHSKS